MTKLKQTSAALSPRYRKFIAKRDKALERILINGQVRVTELLFRNLNQALETSLMVYARLPKESMVSMHSRSAINHLEAALDQLFVQTSYDIGKQIRHTLKLGYALALTGEAEAIGIASEKPTSYAVLRGVIDEAVSKSSRGRDYESIVYAALSKIRKDLVGKIQAMALSETPVDEALEALEKCLPKKKKLKRPSKAFKALESVGDAGMGKQESFFSQGYMDDDLWREVTTEYVDRYIPKSRTGKEVFDVQMPGEKDLTEVADWEVERSMTDEFVSKVRAGQVEAANQNGIEDFQWIAIIDEVTCFDCCHVRDGLTTTEIEAKLSSGEIDKEICDATVPPAHPNCRCRLAPMIKGMPEKPESNEKDFDQWLNS